MTVIAYKDGLAAADSQETMSDGRKQNCKKLFKVGDTIIGTAGDSYTGLIFIDWFKRGAKMEYAPDLSNVDYEEDFECLVIEDTENIYTINRFFQRYDVQLQGGAYAIGCGAGYALVAIDWGLTAKESVQKTIKFDSYCGGKVQTMRAKKA